jgi:hypothetical protein
MYYATMSLFPGVLLALTLLGARDQSLVQNAADYITCHGADPTTTRPSNRCCTRWSTARTRG